MKEKDYYTSGEFAKMAHVSVRTIRFYDTQNILKPTFVNEKGNRFYSDSDFARLQQILLLKYLGFSLDDIREMTIADQDYHFMLNSLQIQKKLIEDRIEQMQLVEKAIEDTTREIEENKQIDWSQMLDLIHLTSMENTLKTQYQNASNISARIRLHRDYSTNKQGWFPWVFEQILEITKNVSNAHHEQTKNITDACAILELGAGNGALWRDNKKEIPKDWNITLSDLSEGMIRDTRRNLRETLRGKQFRFKAFDCQKIPYEDNSFDLVIANHVLFYCDDIGKVCKEVRRVLKPGGVFLCSTYSEHHMKEITDLVQEFDERVVLAGENLYEKFGLSDGDEILKQYFKSVECRNYEDGILIQKPEPLIEYILSCHGNQNQYLLERYHDFRSFVETKMEEPFQITKEAGLFICR